ncbi:MAG TPA: GntR family transcriptional regulator [Anaerolineae bacterium]|nr:GntR family transcriptional regulator [Anaerolineae bacterium]HIQ04695.1 GntR family transcriptional regulator [Anaerolineae bacterium]
MRDAPHLYQRIAETIRVQIARGELKPGDRLPSVRDLARQYQCTPGTVNRAYVELAREGLVTAFRGSGTRVAANPISSKAPLPLRLASLTHRAEQYLLEALSAGYTPAEAEAAFSMALARWQEIERSAVNRVAVQPTPGLRFAGSHDLCVGLLVEQLHRVHPDIPVNVKYVGSLGGLIALTRGEADLAGSHLWDDASDDYNIPFVRRILPGHRVVLLTLVHRRLGLIVAPGNPHKLTSLADLTRPGLRFINRQAGSGTRVWLEAQLRSLNLDPTTITGYDREVTTHTGVARAIAEGRAHVGIGIQAAAAAYDLGFVPLTQERYDLIIPEETWNRPELQAVIVVVRSHSFRTTVQALGGYETQETGHERWVC